MTPANINERAHAMASALVAAISVRDSAAMQQVCGFSSACAQEVMAAADEYFQCGTILALAPIGASGEICAGGRPAIDIFAMDDNTVGMECVLYADGKASEAILHLAISDEDGATVLHYKYMGS